jgi:predicted nucleic acid-binding protein
VSELRKGPACHPRVAAWIASVGDEDLGLSVIVIGEIRRGIEQIRRRDSRRAALLEHWLARLLAEHAESVLPIDRAVAEEWGRLTAVRSGSLVDVLMAATARVHGLTLVTRNVRDVEWTGVSVLNPFET